MKPKISTMHTKRLTIRPFKYEDINDVHEYASNPEITKYMLFGPNTYEDSMNFVHLIIDTWYKWLNGVYHRILLCSLYF